MRKRDKTEDVVDSKKRLSHSFTQSFMGFHLLLQAILLLLLQ